MAEQPKKGLRCVGAAGVGGEVTVASWSYGNLDLCLERGGPKEEEILNG